MLVLIIGYFTSFNKKKNLSQTVTPEVENIESSNLLSELNFSSEDNQGNVYTLKAQSGEIDFENNNIIFLKNIEAIIKLKNSREIFISSNFGKYNRIVGLAY